MHLRLTSNKTWKKPKIYPAKLWCGPKTPKNPDPPEGSIKNHANEC